MSNMKNFSKKQEKIYPKFEKNFENNLANYPEYLKIPTNLIQLNIYTKFENIQK